MPSTHEERPKNNGGSGAEQSVRDKPAEHRREIDETAVPSVDQRCEGDVGHRPAQLEHMPQRGEFDDMLKMPRQ